ncbi:MAG: hypothetical protein KDC04_04465 [Saprospiraceae bacterium]|nr:hypothetical protein [Saprospiraceae bacterium]
MRLLSQLLVVILCISATYTFGQDIQYSRCNDQRGMNIFEPTKMTNVEYNGLKVNIGGAFTQGYQKLSHERADTTIKLYQMAGGFNLAAANLNLNVQLGDGIHMLLENYMAARHHNEFWVKGGYIQIDKLPMFGNPEWFTKYFRVKMGHMEVNYGDQHFRRSDGGNTIFNPFAENYLVDEFATEIGGEVYAFPMDNLMVMLGMTNGLIRNNIRDYAANPANGVTKKSPSILAKVAYDNNGTENLRYRLSASLYTNSETPGNTLFQGDRTGSNYYGVMESTAFDQTANFRSGRVSIGSFNKLTSIMFNPFIKYRGFEFFGTYEAVSGKTIAETDNRKSTQMAVDLIYRFLANEQAYVGVRYNTLKSRLSGYTADVSVDRTAIAAGWFPTKNLLLKGEYVIQNYNDYKTTDILNGGKFNGIVVQAVVGF